MPEDDQTPKPPSQQAAKDRDGLAWFYRIGATFDLVLTSVPVDRRLTQCSAQERLEKMKAGKAPDRERTDEDRER